MADTISSKTIHVIRHAQAFHNLKYKNHSMPDPLLTPKGISQCEELAASFPSSEAEQIELLVSSPLRRAIYTSIYSFPTVVARPDIRFTAHPEAQETGAGLKPCDTGSDHQALQAEFSHYPLDLSLVIEGWNSRIEESQRPSPEALRTRGLIVRQWLKRQSENNICLVSHGGFLHYLTEDWNGFDEKRGSAWKNCEWRTYQFVDVKDENATLVETEESKMRRNTFP